MIEPFISKRNQELLRSTRRIFTKTVHQLHGIVKNKTGIDISIGSILNLKPFYINKPSEREKESCMCKFCLNLRLKFNELQKQLKENEKKLDSCRIILQMVLPVKNIMVFINWNALLLECENCKLVPKFNNNDFDIPSEVHYDQFGNDEYTYINKNDEEIKGKRTIRKTFNEPFNECKTLFDNAGVCYLIHRYECVNDAYLWPQDFGQFGPWLCPTHGFLRKCYLHS